MSAKNLLQELLHKRGSPPPRYETERIGGLDHIPRFVSVVRFGGGLEAQSVASSKKKAEQKAACRAVAILDAREIGAVAHEIGNVDAAREIGDVDVAREIGNVDVAREVDASHTFVLIDHENIQKLPDIAKLQAAGGKVFAFASRTSYLAQQPLPSFVERVLVDSTQKNACDVAAIMKAAWLIQEWGRPVLVFVSRDNIFGTTVELIRQLGVPAHQATSVAECFEFLKTVSA
uniref:Double-stranded RNA binding motif-containing protein n=1 Tax=Marseillevirus LCMAC103 TaxID=2506604 RepID=A0A481YUA6_9VIRU|nr:MAG: double-stranded RNA binding motif-containing protein [Marseillevirus LCMAC103]